MTPQQIKDAAPEGATHYLNGNISGIAYFKANGNNWEYWNYIRLEWCLLKVKLSDIKPL